MLFCPINWLLTLVVIVMVEIIHRYTLGLFTTETITNWCHKFNNIKFSALNSMLTRSENEQLSTQQTYRLLKDDYRHVYQLLALLPSRPRVQYDVLSMHNNNILIREILCYFLYRTMLCLNFAIRRVTCSLVRRTR